MINEKINAIKDRLSATVSPKRIYLFDSFAKDTYTDDSDYDFYIVVPDDAGNKIDSSQKAYRSLRGIRKRPVDIVVEHESSFNARSTENTLAKLAQRQGATYHRLQLAYIQHEENTYGEATAGERVFALGGLGS